MLRFCFAVAILACPLSHAGDAPGAGDVVRLSEPVQVTADYEVFGAPLAQFDGAVPLATLIEQQDEYLGREVLVRARIAKICQKKGCFFVAQDGRYVARVTFVDYAFFVPTDAGGKDVTFAGTLSRKTLSEKAARHYANDAGDPAGDIAGPQPEYAILASAVAVPRS